MRDASWTRSGSTYSAMRSSSGLPGTDQPLSCGSLADVAQLVERNLAKVEVAGSIPVIRSRPLKALADNLLR